jgi:hypothetical protein
VAFNTNLIGFFFGCLFAPSPRLPLWLILDIRTFVSVLNTALGIAAISVCYRLLRDAWTFDYEGVLVNASE